MVIGCWVALAIALPMALPSLTEMTQKHPVAMLPADAPSVVAARQMSAAFGESGSDNVLLVVLTAPDGLVPADEDVYRALVGKLREDTRDVVMVQDFLSAPALREMLTSKDGQAWIVPVGIAGELGSPDSYSAYTRVAGTVRETVAGSPLTVHLTGPAATVADLTDVGAGDQTRIEIAMAVFLIAILLMIYRNPVTMVLPLITIGVSLVTAQAVVAGLAELGLGVSNQTIVFLSAMMAGAGTDYAVFLISRYHDFLRLGEDSDHAVRKALTSVGKVIAASAATVSIAFLAMVFCRLGVFSTVGVALAVAIGVAFLAAVTLLPAILVLAGPRGWVAPARDITSAFWRRSGIRIVRRPRANLIASLVVLVILAGCATLGAFNYDDRKALPDTADSSVGYAAMDRHLPANQSIPQYLFVQSPRDLRTPEALADLEQMAQRISQLPDVATVRGITRPTGESLKQATLAYQAGRVGDKLRDASEQIRDRDGDLDSLASGANLLADNLGQARGQIANAISGVRGLVDALAYLQRQFGAATTFRQLDNAAKLVTGMRSLGDALNVNFADFAATFDWVGPVVSALDTSPTCDADPSCRTTRTEFRRLQTARGDGTFDRIADLARRLQSTFDGQTLEASVNGLRGAVDAAVNAARSLGQGDARGLQSRMTVMQNGADTVSEASRRLADGVESLVDQTKQMGDGVNEASAFLLSLKNAASKPSMAGFSIPSEVLSTDEFKKAAAIFISPDGHAARYLIQTNLNPFSTEAMDQVGSITDVARGAQPNTELVDASMSMTGYPTTLRDTRDSYDHDMALIVLMTIAVVLLILIVLLRAVVAPLYLIGSVVLSYLSALGIGVVVFQFILGQQLHWSVPALAFILLVAMGADYNLLLMSRLRDESSVGIRSGIIRTVGSTGGVITAAGLIFAASMFGLLFSSIGTIVQAGFVVGVGILLDTFVVRTITVPATAALLGRANWWPSSSAHFRGKQVASQPQDSV
jgi:RND superfamily putative drug exporter